VTPKTPDKFNEVVELAQVGLSGRAIADELGMGRSAVSYRLHMAADMGLLERPKRPDPWPLEEVARMSKEGMGNGEIAAALGTDRSTIGRWKHEARRKGMLPRFVPTGGYTTAQSEIRRKLRARLGSMAMILDGMTDDQMRWLLRLVPEDGTLADVIRGMVIDVYHEEAGNGG
jgi:transposase